MRMDLPEIVAALHANESLVATMNFNSAARDVNNARAANLLCASRVSWNPSAQSCDECRNKSRLQSWNGLSSSRKIVDRVFDHQTLRRST